MKEVIKTLLSQKIILKKLEPIDLNLRKKIDVYSGVDKNSRYIAVFYMQRKSRFLQKDAQSLEEIYFNLLDVSDHNYKKKILIYDMPMCSKAQALLKEYSWKCIHAVD